MQFSVNKNTLLSNIQKVSKVSPARSTMPILNSILFELEQNKLTLRTSDIEITMSTFVEVKGIEDGAIAIPSRMILDIINELDDSDIEIKTDGDACVTVTSSHGVYKIPGRPGDEFPSVPKINLMNYLTVNNKLFSRMIQKSIIAVSKDELRPSLTGVLLQIKEGEIRAVSTDGHRLVCMITREFNNQNFERDVVIPAKFLNLLLGYISNDGETVLGVGENHIRVELDSTVIYSRLIDDKFPDYQSVIPTSNPNIMTAEVNHLSSALKRVGIFTNKATHQVRMTLDGETRKISAENKEQMSSAEEKIEVDYEGDNIEIGFNADYLRELLRNIESPNVLIKLKTNVNACLVLPENQDENEILTMLLMPIRLE
ncbi:MAG: DNA polymerase III subunit beta [Candidatus Marinimicrobia bacterium]|nr:DNA polymerase III subunit beta [Candidatus Neomarinimicrobiota bacterium]